MGTTQSLSKIGVVDWTIQTVVGFRGELTALQKDAIKQLVIAYHGTRTMKLGDALKFIAPQFDSEEAENISCTVLTCMDAYKVQVEGERMKEQWKKEKVIKTWFTCNDDLLCPICGKLEGRKVGIYKEFIKGISTPPAHLGCRCWISSETTV